MLSERNHWRKTHAGSIRILHLAILDLLGQLETLSHDLHVGLNHRIAKSTEFLVVLLSDNISELFLADLIILQE